MCHGQVTSLWGAICHPDHRKIICIYTLYIYMCVCQLYYIFSYVYYIYIMYIMFFTNKYVLTYIIPIDGWMTFCPNNWATLQC